mgnify:CR=1 FL=1
MVANDAPGLRDSVKNGETGLLYKENDAADLAATIEKVLRDEPLRASLQERGREWAHSFSWDTNAQKVEQWLKKAVEKKSS